LRLHVVVNLFVLSGLGYQYRTQFDRTNKRQFDRRKEPITAFALHCTDRSELPETSWLYLDLGRCRSASAWVRCDTDFLRGVIDVRCHSPDSGMRV
jgi:hypothetical protein